MNTTINAVAEAIRDASNKYDDYTQDVYVVCAQAAIEAYDKASVREMTVDEVAELLRKAVKSAPIDLGSAYSFMARELGKLGTIRIVVGGE